MIFWGRRWIEKLGCRPGEGGKGWNETCRQTSFSFIFLLEVAVWQRASQVIITQGDLGGNYDKGKQLESWLSRELRNENIVRFRVLVALRGHWFVVCRKSKERKF